MEEYFSSNQPSKPVASFRCVPRNKFGWYCVEVFGRSIDSAKNTTDVLRNDLQDLCAANGINLRTFYIQEGGESEVPGDPCPIFTFFVNDYKLARKLQIVEIPPDSRLQLNVSNKVPNVRVDNDFREKLKAVMLAHYTPSSHVLDLYAFHNDPQFMEEFCCLAQHNCMSAVIEIMGNTMPHLKRLILDYNGISDLSPFHGIEHKLPEVTYISLQFNDLTDVESFRVFEHLPLTQMDIYSNPVDMPSQRKELVEMLTKLTMMDGHRARPSRALFWKEGIDKINPLKSIHDSDLNTIQERTPKSKSGVVQKRKEQLVTPKYSRVPKPEPKVVEVQAVQSDFEKTPKRIAKNTPRSKLVVVLKHGAGLKPEIKEVDEPDLDKTPKQTPRNVPKFDFEQTWQDDEEKTPRQVPRHLPESNLMAELKHFEDSKLELIQFERPKPKLEVTPVHLDKTPKKTPKETQKNARKNAPKKTPKLKEDNPRPDKEELVSDLERTPRNVAKNVPESKFVMELKLWKDSNPELVHLKGQEPKLDATPNRDSKVGQVTENATEPNQELKDVKQKLLEPVLQKISKQTPKRTPKLTPKQKDAIQKGDQKSGKEELASDLEKTPKRVPKQTPKRKNLIREDDPKPDKELVSDQENQPQQVPKNLPESNFIMELKYREESKPELILLEGQPPQRSLKIGRVLQPATEPDQELKDIEDQLQKSDLEKTQKRIPTQTPKRTPKQKDEFESDDQKPGNEERASDIEKLPKRTPKRTPKQKDDPKPVEEELVSDLEKTPKQVAKHLPESNLVMKLKYSQQQTPKEKDAIQKDDPKPDREELASDVENTPKQIPNQSNLVTELKYSKQPTPIQTPKQKDAIQKDNPKPDRVELVSDLEKNMKQVPKHLPEPYLVMELKHSKESKPELMHLKGQKRQISELVTDSEDIKQQEAEPDLNVTQELILESKLKHTPKADPLPMQFEGCILKAELEENVKKVTNNQRESKLKHVEQHILDANLEDVSKSELIQILEDKPDLEETPNWIPKSKFIPILENASEMGKINKPEPELGKTAKHFPESLVQWYLEKTKYRPDPKKGILPIMAHALEGKLDPKPDQEQIPKRPTFPYFRFIQEKLLEPVDWEQKFTKNRNQEQSPKRQKKEDLCEYGLSLIEEETPWYIPTLKYPRDPKECSLPIKYYLTDAGYNDLQRFLNEYIKVYDNDRYRSGIEWFYQESAVITFTYTEEAYSACLYPLLDEHNRHVTRFNKDYHTETRESAVKYFSAIPKTKHIRPTMIVDLMVMTPNWICFTITGFLREVNRKTGTATRYCYFMRTFVLTPLSETCSVPDFRIHCEITYTTITTADQFRKGLIPPRDAESDFMCNIVPELESRNLMSGIFKYGDVFQLSQTTKVNEELCCDILIECKWDPIMSLDKMNKMIEEKLIPDEAFLSEERLRFLTLRRFC